MKKRILSLLLALVMLIGLVPTAVIPAFAAEESEEQPKVDSKGYILIWSYEQLVSVAQNARSNENYRLATDIYQTDNSNDLGILVRCDSLSLDLNGHVLSRETMSLDSALFFVCDGSTLNIYDTSPDSTGTCIYNNNYVSDTCSVINNSGGNVIINGGNYIVKMYNPSFKASVLYGTSGEFTVYDGYFDSTQASNGNAVNMHYSNSLYDEPNCTIYGGRFYSQRTCIEARSLANYSDVYYPYVFVLGGEFYTKRSNGDEYEGNFAYCNNGWGRVIAANGLVPARSLNARDQRYATGTTTTVETLTGEPGNGWKYATVTPPPRIVSEQLPKEDRWYSLCWRDYLKAAKENESYDFWTANQEAIEAELAKIDGFSVNIFDTEVTLSIEDKKEIDSVRWYVSASPYSGWTELVDYQNITGPVTQDPPKPGKTLYYRAVVTRKGGTEYEDIIYVNCEEPTEDVTPAFTTQPTGGTVGYNERHTVNWATNFDAVKQELVRYSPAGNVLQTTALSAGAFQAGLSYMADGYYYRIRAYYDYYSNAYVESNKFYVTTDPYFTPNYEHGNEEGDIIEGITYVPNGDGTFNANVHVDLSYVDGQMLQYYWASTGYYWYDHNNKLNYGIGTTDTSKLVFTLYNLGENLVPGKEWKVKVYLADDPYADYEWREVDFHYVTDTVPELKPEDVPTPVFTTQPVGGEVAKGEKLTVNWETNFTPVKQVLLRFIVHPVDGLQVQRTNLSASARSTTVSAAAEYYIIRSYYSDTGYVDSNKFTVTEVEVALNNGLVVVDGVWGYYKDGVLQTDYTGLVPYGDLIFYVENGILDFTYTGLAWYNDAWTYVANSQLTQGYTGLVWFNDNWFYVVDSVIDWTFTGLVPYEGNYFYVQNNHLDWSYTGLGYHDGGWYFIQNGLLQKNYSGLVYFNDNWFYVEEGVLTYQYFGMVEYEGNLFYVQASHLDWSYTGLGYHEGAWYYFQNALYTPSFTGLVPFDGSLFYVKNGTVDWTYNGTAVYEGVTYTVKDGVAQ